MKAIIQRVAVLVVVMGLFLSVSAPSMANCGNEGCSVKDEKAKTSASCDKETECCEKTAACDKDKKSAACDSEKKCCEKDVEAANAATTAPRIQVSYKDFGENASETKTVAAAPKSSVSSAQKNHPLEYFDVQVDGFL
jgi:hypothetical protein